MRKCAAFSASSWDYIAASFCSFLRLNLTGNFKEHSPSASEAVSARITLDTFLAKIQQLVGEASCLLTFTGAHKKRIDNRHRSWATSVCTKSQRSCLKWSPFPPSTKPLPPPWKACASLVIIYLAKAIKKLPHAKAACAVGAASPLLITGSN